MIKIAVSGVAGRMGREIAAQALADKVFRVVGALEAPKHAALGQDLGQSLGRPSTQVIITEDAASALADAQVLIEFTTPEATIAHARAAAGRKVMMVVGTTGLTSVQQATLKRLARRTPIFWAPNMSMGVLVMRRMLAEAAAVLKASGLERGVELRIAETHHAQKKDKPSGTAKQLAEDLTSWFPLSENEIPIQAKREGEVIGVHNVALTLGEERLTVQHEALSRGIFARGALIVARLMVERVHRPGFYTMDTLYKKPAKR
ncbi:MAG: 4-hydroxy-tetrahydrodipicolinate reductase [Candidatus Omnitrophica bacterium]|nr:4-hydroxy-tetrahydrodipicolinate reductase [Candidatus Omnitrophota bacterium]